MSDYRVGLSGAHIALFFSNYSDPKLDRIVFTHPLLPQALVSNRRTPKGEPGRQFKWTKALRGLCVLLIRTAGSIQSKTDEKFEITGDKSSLASALSRALISETAWLINIFGSAPNGDYFFKKLIVAEKIAGRSAVGILKEILLPEHISISIEDRLVSDPVEMLRMATKIEESNSSLFACEAPQSRNPRREQSGNHLYPQSVSEEIRHRWSHEIPPVLLKLYQKAVQKTMTGANFQPLLSKLGDLGSSGLSVHLSQNTEIQIANERGDARVKFQFEVLNLGFRPFSERVHAFWFERPQTHIDFQCFDEFGNKISITTLKSTPHHRQISVSLCEPLQPMGKIRYEITFDVPCIFQSHQFYFLSPTTITNLLSLTVVSAAGHDFREAYVIHESVDGYIRDDSPLVAISQIGQSMKLSWQTRSPRLGDLFRTFWSSTRSRNASSSLAIDLN